MILRLCKIVASGAVAYMMAKRYREGSFAFLNMRGCKESLDDAAECAKQGLSEVKAKAKKGVCKEV